MKNKKVVCFGGGTGLSTLLSGLKNKPELELTAVVTVFDDGGSSGILRDQLGILPPGDIFRCIAASAPDEDQKTIRKIFQKRLANGHTGGNIFLVGGETVYKDYQTAIDELSKAVSANCRVIPVSFARESQLHARFSDGTEAVNEPAVDAGIREGKVIERLFLEPSAQANPEVLKVIEQADIICIGPGSFYTSILPNFLPDGIAEAIRNTDSAIIYIANLMTEGLSMNGWRLSDYVKDLSTILNRCIDIVVANREFPTKNVLDRYALENRQPVFPDYATNNPRIALVTLWSDGAYVRHDSQKLADILNKLITAGVTPV